MIKKSKNRILKKIKNLIYKIISLSNILNLKIRKSIDIDQEFIFITIRCNKDIGLGLYKYLVKKNIEKEILLNNMVWKYNYYNSIFTRGSILPENNTEFIISVSIYMENNMKQQLTNLYKKLK